MQSPQQQREIVRRMVEAGEPEENIALVIRRFEKTAAPTTTPQTQQPQGPSMMETALQRSGIPGMIDVAKGAGKRVLDYAVSGGEILHKIPGVSGAVDRLYGQEGLSQQSFPQAHEALAPQNTGEAIGRFGTDVASMAVPMGQVTRATQAMNLPARMAAQGATATTVAGVQTGGDPEAMAIAGAFGAAAPAVGAGFDAAKRGVTQFLPEKLYAQIFKYAENDLRKAYQAVAKGKTPNASLAKEALERGIAGNSDDMAVYALQKTAELEKQLQTNAARSVMVMPDKAKYIGLLKEIQEQFGAGFFSYKADDAAKLIDDLSKMPGPTARATDMLRVKRFLDAMRTNSSFRANQVLGPRQDELKVAADRVRSALHRNPKLSPLLKEESVFINATDAIIDDAVRRGNSSVFNIIDAALSAAGPGGVLAAGAVRGSKLPSVITKTAQGLYRMGQAAPSGTTAANTGSAVASVGTRKQD